MIKPITKSKTLKSIQKQNTQKNLAQEKINIQNENNRQIKKKITKKFKDKDDGIQLSTRYQQYKFAKRYLRGTSGSKVFPITRGNKKALKQIIGGGQGNRVYDTLGTSCTIASQAGGQGAKTGLYAVKNPLKGKTDKGWHFEQNVFDDGGISRALKSSSGSGNKLKVITRGRSTQPWMESNIAPTVRQGDKADVRAVLTPDRAKKRQNGRRMKTNGEPSFTLTKQDIHGIYDGTKIRRLTPTETERLQGFPDNWTSIGHEDQKISDTQRYKMMGNAVTTNVVSAIISRLVNNP